MLTDGLAVEDEPITNKPFNKLTDAEAEALAWLVEEASEVITAVSKILRFGLHSSNPKEEEDAEDNRGALNRELGDMQAALCLCSNLGIISETIIARECLRKIETSGEYLRHQSISFNTWWGESESDDDGYSLAVQQEEL